MPNLDQKERKVGGKKENSKMGERNRKAISAFCLFGWGRNGPTKHRNAGEWIEFRIRTFKHGQCLGAATNGEERIAKRNVLSLSTHALMREDYVVSLG